MGGASRGRVYLGSLVAVGALGLIDRYVSTRISEVARRRTYTLDVGKDHLLDELVERDLALPAEDPLSLGRGAVEELNLSGTLF